MKDIAVQADQSSVTTGTEGATALTETPAEPDEPKSAYWPDDWREATAAAVAGDDARARAREMKRL
jgi:hypothetical protein